MGHAPTPPPKLSGRVLNERLIDRPDALEALCAQLDDSPWVATDTEFLRDKTYFPRLCLVQVATPDLVACVDPLAIEDMEPFWRCVMAPGRCLVMHSAEQDLENFYLQTKRLPAVLFDTQLAASMLGHGEQVSYAKLVESMLGVTLGKGYTRTNWARRPLPEGPLKYAADDVRYLRDLYPDLRDELAAMRRSHWPDDDHAALLDPTRYGPRPEQAWRRVKGKGRCRGRSLAALQAVAAWREQDAMRADRPRRWILEDAVVVDLALRAPTTVSQIAHFGPRGARAEALLDALRAGTARPEEKWPVHDFRRALSGAEEDASDGLMQAIIERAEALSVSPSALATRAQVRALAAGGQATELRSGWRGRVLEDLIQEFLPDL
jgi:ribonuclease D